MLKNCVKFQNRIVALAIATALGTSGMAFAGVAPASVGAIRAMPVRAAGPTNSTGGASFNVLTRATRLAQGDVVANTVPLGKSVHVTVALNLRNVEQLKALLAQPRRGAISQAQLQAYLPTAAQAEQVAQYLRAQGFSGVTISPNRMLVKATGTAAAVQSAFKTQLVDVHTHDGRNAFANSAAIQVPAALAGSVQAVLGLQTVHVAHALSNTADTGRVGVGGHYPQEFADIYGASNLAPATGVDVAVWGWGSMQPAVADLDAFMDQTGLSAGSVAVVCAEPGDVIVADDPTCNNVDMGTTEWDMDSQAILGMTGGVKSLTFYAAYGGYSNTLTDALNEIVSPSVGEPLAQVINASFGGCERGKDASQGGDGSAQVDDSLFMLAAAQGQTFSVATGDFGADECGDGQPDSASYPASSPWVVAVSGTELRASTSVWARENVWFNSGGSPSSFEQAQPWQAGLTAGPFAGARGPDVAFDASAASGGIILIDGGYQQWGGTSLAAPIFAGAWARILQNNPGLGFAAPSLYTLPAAALHDVMSGNNGGYVARRGWDWASGLGSFDVGRAAAILRQQ